MKKFIKCVYFLCISCNLMAQNIVENNIANNHFTLVNKQSVAAIWIDTKDDWLVTKSVSLLQQDIKAVSGKMPHMFSSNNMGKQSVIIIGTANQSSIIKQLIQEKKLSVRDIMGKWEAYKIVTINHPYANIDKALVIVGSDKRGTAYGVFELSKQIGVSPWFWWADVPVKKVQTIAIKLGSFTFASPKVKYRGIFINDEAPAFSGWTKEKFGGVNHFAYEHVFELLLRLKANYMWPAMWGNAFNDDDTLNPILADKYGIVMGTSHHEPMLRAQTEWKRYGKGAWNYHTNDSVLRSFWRRGIVNMKKYCNHWYAW